MISFLIIGVLRERRRFRAEGERGVVLLDSFRKLGLLLLDTRLLLLGLVVLVLRVLDKADAGGMVEFLVCGGKFGVQSNQDARELLHLRGGGGRPELFGGGGNVLPERIAARHHVCIYVTEVPGRLVDGGELR